MSQQGDVRLFQTDDGGDILVENGLVALDGGLGTMAYLSMFGGNDDDEGGDDKTHTWWANLAETDPAFRFRSETQSLLKSLVISSQNLLRVEAAAGRDLEWMVEKGVASSIEVSASVQGLNTITIKVTVEADGDESDFVFAENWKASA